MWSTRSRWFERLATAAIVAAVFSAGEVLGRAVVFSDSSCLEGSSMQEGVLVCPATNPCTQPPPPGATRNCRPNWVTTTISSDPPQSVTIYACLCDGQPGSAGETCSPKLFVKKSLVDGSIIATWLSCSGGCDGQNVHCTADQSGERCTCQ